jgi:hypothetical protein
MKRAIGLVVLAVMVCAGRPAFAWDPADERAPAGAPAPPDEIYLVTDAYAGDAVTRDGPLTTYSTETVHEITGSYARLLEHVGTGASSAYDGAAFNGRASLTDGRAVAGTYYENYVFTGDGFVAVSVVFFQDDSEIARRSRTVPAAPRSAPVPPDRSIEVLRGRRISVSFDGTNVRSWRFVSGEAVALGPLSGGAGEAFVGRWDRLASPNGFWLVRFLIDYADGTTHEVAVRVTVRSPGLVE